MRASDVTRRFRVLARPIPALGWIPILISAALWVLNIDTAHTFFLQHRPVFVLIWQRISSPAGQIALYGLGILWLVCAVIFVRAKDPIHVESQATMTHAPAPTASSRSSKARPNLIVSTTQRSGIRYDEETDTWHAENLGVRAALLAVTLEPRAEEANVGGYIRASAIFKDPHGSEIVRVNPCWIDEPYIAKEFRVGDTHKLIVACTDRDLLLTINNRRQTLARYETDTTQLVQLPAQDCLVELQFIDANEGHLLLKKNMQLGSANLAITFIE